MLQLEEASDIHYLNHALSSILLDHAMDDASRMFGIEMGPLFVGGLKDFPSTVDNESDTASVQFHNDYLGF
jgi:hypothetical protein